MLGDRLAGEGVYLDCAHDAALVGRVELCRALRVKAAQSLYHRLAAKLVILRIEPFAQSIILRPFGKVKPRDERINVQIRAACNYRQPAACQYILHCFIGIFNIARYGIDLGRVNNVYHVMRNTLHLGMRYLGRTNVHTTVYLHGVGRDYLAAEIPCKLNGKARFARCRRACYNNDLICHIKRSC